MIGTPYTDSATTALLLGAGELGKEVAIELMRLGVEVVACDRYPNAPAMQIAHRSHVLDMTDPNSLRRVIEEERPQLIVPEIEAIATDVLVELEQDGYKVVPTARATQLTMDREGIRRLAAEELNLACSPYAFVSSEEELASEAARIGFPCVVKPVMSSSGKGQSVLRGPDDVCSAYKQAHTGGRAESSRLIVEGFVPFDYEITLLTVRHVGGTLFCPPIGHVQEGGDYQESWQPQPMPEKVLAASRQIARTITDSLGGYGVFGVELFICGNQVLFSEVSPRPHDTGMVTMISQDLSEFALHARALLGLPIPGVECYGSSASHVIIGSGKSRSMEYVGLGEALSIPQTEVRLFGKPEINGRRRLGVCLAKGGTVEQARAKAKSGANAIKVGESKGSEFHALLQ